MRLRGRESAADQQAPARRWRGGGRSGCGGRLAGRRRGAAARPRAGARAGARTSSWSARACPGLIAARELARAGRSVAVLEARDRVGGRMLSRTVAGGREVVDLGAEFIGPTQNHIRALVDELGIGTFPSYATGKNVYVAGGRRTTYADTGPTGQAPPDLAVLPDLLLAVPALDSMAKSVPVDAPWKAARAGEWDSQSLESWMRAQHDRRQAASATSRPPRSARSSPPSRARSRCCSPCSSSRRRATSATPGRSSATSRRATARSRTASRAARRRSRWRWRGGLGRRVVRRSPVRRIVAGRGYVDVISDRYVNRARQVIVALPPALAGRIQYEPALPALRDGLTQRLPQGHMVKVQAIYERPFWRGGRADRRVGRRRRAAEHHVRQLAASRARRACCSGFAGGDEAPAVRGAAGGRAPRRRARRASPGRSARARCRRSTTSR